ncbi:endonuclease/exonuclease/phosphatase family protein [Cryobacterium psychrophilum]|uniref:Endonuclease/exonuclease/phosphatase family protein n=1 Tax=Cryobacterium psychrophilum TaxID=41988 RepID=A0A4Y8KRT7_9MICO|nr:endonuclease/exonuclease/phosphatase family protein [Cryobacterium psychrophilum]TDW31075.1 endonuclease/exonuclease/phosphatase (EEP) superfamily protein YafD [Cryobacterium psychrophilum]TFD78624.1 endonuclease/exonuclease/phosphatase family protein [Cryobacterium psychrophilum]
MKVISYNLRKNRASGELIALSERYDPDLLCLQECDTRELPEEVGLLHLADSTVRNRLGLAIYYRKDRFTSEHTKTFALKKSLHDRLLTPAHERLIGTRLTDLVASRELIVASFHAAPLTAMNSLRRNQIRTAHEELHELGPGLPTLMVGDYNYPMFKGRLGDTVNKSGYDLTLSDTSTYTRYKFFSGHFDLATSIGLTIENVETLPIGSSDHLPILVTSSYGDEPHNQTDIPASLAESERSPGDDAV